MEDARIELDNKKRDDLYRSIEKQINDEAPAVLYDKEKVEYFASNKIKGIKIGQGISSSDRFSNVWDWYIKEERKK